MNNTNETTPRPEPQNDIIVLGVASVETMGGTGNVETMGRQAGNEISEE